MNNRSFLELISEHCIEIPVIQRDYAQGRDTKRSKAIRKAFVERIFKALLNESEPIHLNFVYGKIKGLKNRRKVEENKRAIKLMLNAVDGYSKSLDLDVCCTVNEKIKGDEKLHTTTFIPLDGQQRLTTLFLVHWYLFKRLANEAAMKENLTQLKNFSYLIRPSTKRFCRELIDQPLLFVKGMLLSDQITDSSWFFQYWRKDPSVSGMLNMLDEIHRHGEKLGNEKIMTLALRLMDSGDKQPISFELLNLDDFEMTDKLYVKMNSRGKQLTPYENFKAWLMEYIEEQKIKVSIPNWCEKLDTTWTNLFWKHKDDSSMLVDKEFMRFFRNMMQIDFMLRNKLEASKDGKDKESCAENLDIARRLATRKGEDGEYVFMEHAEFDEIGVLSEESINRMFQCLELFSSQDDVRVGRDFCRFVSATLKIEDKAQFFATYRFLKDCGEDCMKEELPRFYRVYDNLIKNSEIDSLQVLKMVFKGLNKSSFGSGTYKRLLDGRLVFTGFRGSQIKEERLKASLLLRKPDAWLPLISRAENHGFFSGQIGFIFALNGLFKNKEDELVKDWLPEREKRECARFEETSSIVFRLFDEKGFKDAGTCLIERALLACGDTLYRKSSKKIFISNNKDRDRSWHRVLREYDADEQSDYHRAWSAFKQLIKHRKEGKSEQDVIDGFDVRVDWRYAFIKWSETIKKCGSRRSFIEWGRQRYLLSGFRRSSPYSELESFHLYKAELENKLDRITPFTSVEYFSCRQKDGYPCVIIRGYEIGQIQLSIHIRFKGWKTEDAWEIRLFADRGDLNIISDAEILNIDWKRNDEKEVPSYCQYFDQTYTHTQIAIKIEQIARGLNSLRDKYE